jgi:hypothetical protein
LAVRRTRSLRRRGAVDEGGRRESGEQRKPKGDILDPVRPCGHSDQEQRSDPPSAYELGRHQTIGVAGR